jgi:hypothetical protein
LPLIVPPGCFFRVGNEVREWREGALFIFDDTIEHEAWNDSKEDRVGADLRYLAPGAQRAGAARADRFVCKRMSQMFHGWSEFTFLPGRPQRCRSALSNKPHPDFAAREPSVIN